VYRLSFFAFVLLGLCATSVFADATADDLKALDGKWQTVSGEAAGNSLPDDVLKKLSFSAKAGKYTFNLDTTTDHGTFKLDASKKPKTLDAEGTEGPNKGVKYLGIYEITDKDTVKICYDLEGNRPMEFKTASGQKRFLFVLKREKP
jgi:uncharacterized protein (TIGR03067 family)